MKILQNILAAFTAAISVFSIQTVHADTIKVDLSANVSESVLPGGTVFHNSAPLFGAVADPKQTTQLLYTSPVGVNASGRSTNISGAFASSLAESDGNGGVGVSQLIFGSPDGSGDGVRELFAQSLWTHTFLYDGAPAHDILHLNIPTLQVGLLGVPPRRTGPSATETAEADARVDEVVTHPDGSITQGLFEFGIREFETQVPSGSDLLNLVDKEILEHPNPLVFTPTLRFNGDDFNPSFTLEGVSFDLKLHDIQAGDIVSWVYTLTAEGTTHGFERGYYAFLGDPFGGEPVSGNLSETIALVDATQPGTGGGTPEPGTGADVPEPGTGALMLLGLAGLLMWRWWEVASVRTEG